MIQLSWVLLLPPDMRRSGSAMAPAPAIHEPPHPSLVRDASRLQGALMELMRVLRSRDRDRASGYSLSASQCHTLQALARQGPMTVNDLAARLYLEKSTASRLAASLMEKDLVRKRAARTDGRTVVLQVTEKGLRLSRRILNDLAVEYMELLKQLDPEVRSALPQLLDRITSIVAGRSGDAGPPDCA
jgi:MarR family transcriptional regulator, 2-MHQ and catechol-resistance regulon repressor